MRCWLRVDANAVRANDADGHSRPILVLEDDTGRVYTAQSVKGKGFEVQTQQSHPREDRPEAWIEFTDADKIELRHHAELEAMRSLMWKE